MGLIDYSVIQGYATDGMEKEILRELDGYFKTSVPLKITAARQALGAQNIKLFGEHMHALKNSFLNVGALKVAEQCQSLQDQAAQLPPAAVLHELESINDNFILVQSEINTILSTH